MEMTKSNFYSVACGWRNSSQAVSYTHLDVYKRQLFTRCMTIAMTNARVYDDLRHLGASSAFLRRTVKGQIARVFFVPLCTGTLLIYAFFAMILYFNSGSFTPGELAGLCLLYTSCDDARESRFQLRVLLERALEGRSAPARLLEFSSGDALLGWMDRHAGELDLVFLDIELEGTNGMDTARALREADQSLQLVFVTGYSDYVFDGYEVGALGYLLKPAGAEELEKVLTRALTALQRQEE